LRQKGPHEGVRSQKKIAVYRTEANTAILWTGSRLK
jgi:hypothetical protein